GRHRLDVLRHARLAQAHDGALAELLLDLAQRRGQGLGLVVVHATISRNPSHYHTRPRVRTPTDGLAAVVVRPSWRALPPASAISPRNACATVRRRTVSRSPRKRRVSTTHFPGSRAHAKHTVPTGFSGVPPPGPATPETAT